MRHVMLCATMCYVYLCVCFVGSAQSWCWKMRKDIYGYMEGMPLKELKFEAMLNWYLHVQFESLKPFQDHQHRPVGWSSASSHQRTRRGHHSRGRARANNGSAACHDHRSADVRFTGPNCMTVWHPCVILCTSNSCLLQSLQLFVILWTWSVWRTMTKMHNCWFHPAGWVIVLALLISGAVHVLKRTETFATMLSHVFSRFFLWTFWTMCSVVGWQGMKHIPVWRLRCFIEWITEMQITRNIPLRWSRVPSVHQAYQTLQCIEVLVRKHLYKFLLGSWCFFW